MLSTNPDFLKFIEYGDFLNVGFIFWVPFEFDPKSDEQWWTISRKDR